MHYVCFRWYYFTPKIFQSKETKEWELESKKEAKDEEAFTSQEK